MKLQPELSIPIHYNIDPDTQEAIDDLNNLKNDVRIISQSPVNRAITIMPDASRAGGPAGTIGVGMVVVSEEAIIPEYHSADISCSMGLSAFENADPKQVLDAAMAVVHFGQGGRDKKDWIYPSDELLTQFQEHPYLSTKKSEHIAHHGSSGDGNHFLVVGRSESTGRVCVVTHWGSRRPGALLYNVGSSLAQKMTKLICPEVPYNSAWIDYNTDEGRNYWSALQIIREWTKSSHFAIHDMIARKLKLDVLDRTYNTHNFVYKRQIHGKNYFFHAKGSTPSWLGYEDDCTGKTIIPLNMAAPILIGSVKSGVDVGTDFINDASLGFAPHGAGRMRSRKRFAEKLAEQGITPKQLISETLSKVDARAFSGKHDISEFPAAYKDPDKVISEIERFGLTTIVDKIIPTGSIMAGHPASKKEKKKKAEIVEDFGEEI